MQTIEELNERIDSLELTQFNDFVIIAQTLDALISLRASVSCIATSAIESQEVRLVEIGNRILKEIEKSDKIKESHPTELVADGVRTLDDYRRTPAFR